MQNVRNDHRTSVQGSAEAVLADFDRTLTLLFDDRAMEAVRANLVDLYTTCGIPACALQSVNPYTLWMTVHGWMRWHGWIAAELINQRATDLLSRHEYHAAQESRLFGGARSSLEWLDEQGIPVVIVSTNATRAVELALNVNKVDHLVSVVLGRDDHRIDMSRLKPNPDLIHEGVRRVRDRPVLLVGDSVNDMIAGRRAGVPTVGVTTGECSSEELMAAGAAMVMPSFGDLPSVMGRVR